MLPWTWSGGGGPPGNRYFFSAYPLLLFLVPPGISVAPGVLAWIGGALFTAKMLVNPFWAAKFPYLVIEKGPARRLPVELTMANDLPVRLAQPLRGRCAVPAPIPACCCISSIRTRGRRSRTAWVDGGCSQHLGLGRRPRRHHRPHRVAGRSHRGRGRSRRFATVADVALGAEPVTVTIGAGEGPDVRREGVRRPRLRRLQLPADDARRPKASFRT